MLLKPYNIQQQNMAVLNADLSADFGSSGNESFGVQAKGHIHWMIDESDLS